ncbi:Tc toxin subunit A-related protein [Sphaerisporangium rhizosphaerae]|uniref:Hemopexin repeat-containing protein n=1 Tax=Sphaerisporangium rhizosphaerae TaxID=2269375 RepID=A0ABW2PAV8_9ACTN
MRVGDSLPNYQLLFGNLDFRPGDEARSVTSPAAYLADLLRLLEEEVGDATLLQRRHDIQQIPLDAEHTTTELPYVDIVVEILERLVGENPYEQMRTMAFPFDKPFNLAYERLGTFLRERGIGRDELPRLLGAEPGPLAAEFLGLSPEVAAVVSVAHQGEADLRRSFDLGRTEQGQDEQLSDLAPVERFRRTVALSEIELDELLAARFVGQVAVQDGTLVLPEGAALAAWLDRVNRFVRLARRTGLSFPDLDLVLIACCQSRLDAAALGVLAAVVHVSRSLSLPIDVTVSLAAPMPADLEVRTFAAVTVAEALGLSPAEVDRLRARFGEVVTGEIALSALHRAARLMTAVRLTADELFDLLTVIDGSITVPFATTRTMNDCRMILAAPDPGSGLWLAQALPLAVRRARDGGLSAQDLAAFAGGPAKDPAEASGEPAEGEADLAAALAAQLATVAPGPGMFVSQRFSDRASRAIWDALRQTGAYGAVTGMAQVTAADFVGLGLGDGLATKIFTNLVLRGSLSADGELAEVPTELATDFSPYHDKVAELLGDLVDMCYPSDLAGLTGLSDKQRAELYDNLIYNAYIASDGTILNAEIDDLDVDLDDLIHDVIALMRTRADDYLKEPLAIELEFDVPGLLENLRFNGYINGDGHYRDKDALAELEPADFAIASQFEPYKEQVLEAMKAQIIGLWEGMCVFPPEAFSEIADLAVARQIIAAGQIDGDDVVAAERLRAIVEEQRPYRFDRDSLSALGLDEAQAGAILGGMIDAGDLDEGLAVPEDRLTFFCEPNSVLEFALTGAADFSTEAFAQLHAVALETRAAMTEIETTLGARRQASAAALSSAAEDAFGIPGPVIDAICAGVGAELTDLLEPPTLAYRRIAAFARLAAKLSLDATAVALAFDDLRLVARYPEPLSLPAGGPTVIDAVLESSDGHVYVFAGDRYWRFQDRLLVDSAQTAALAAGLTKVDAAFRHPSGADWLVSGSRAYVRQPGSGRWIAHDQVWGRIRDAFAGGGKITAALVDDEGRTYLFCGDQYVRYSTTDFSAVDEGFPRPAADFGVSGLSEPGFFGRDGEFHSFTAEEEFWTQPDDAGFDGRLDAAFADKTGVYVFRGDRVVRHTASLETDGAHADEGFPVRIETRFPGVPAEFESDLDAVFSDADGVVHLFKDGRTIALTEDAQVVPTTQRWGAMPAAFPGGTVDAAFVGLDGRTYLFGGATYIRYSTADYSRADLGYPRSIASDWGGLTSVDAGFVLDGETYLFGGGQFVRYSTSDYTKPDEGYPQPLPGNWWNLPDGFGPTVDAVFTDAAGRTFLFHGGAFIEFDARRRWWSAPRTLAGQWDSLPFKAVDAAFTGRDGRTYVFYGPQYVRYATADYSQVDDGYPAPVSGFWGRARNNLTRTGRVDAALALDGDVLLFSGDQYIRYTGTTAHLGYPRPLPALRTEPRLTHLTADLDGVDAAFADRGNVHLFRGDACHVVSDVLCRTVEVSDVTCAFIEDGRLVVEGKGGWRRQGSIEGPAVVTGPARPRVLREAPESFRSGLDAVLSGTDGVTYLFKGDACYDTLVDRAYPIAEAWGRPRALGAVEAAFTGRDGRTYFFSGDHFTDDHDARPRGIAEAWGGLTSVAIAYVWQDATYLFERPDADGFMRYVVYSGADYAEPDSGYPQAADAGYWGTGEIPLAVLPVGDTLVLLSGQTYRLPDGSPPRPIGLLWRGFEGTITTAYAGADGAAYFYSGEQYRRYADGAFGPLTTRAGEAIGRVDAAFTWEGRTYLISGDRYARYSTDEYVYADPGYPMPMSRHFRAEFPGLPESFEDALTTVDAAVTDQRSLYLFMGGRCHIVSRTLEATYENLAGRTRTLDGPLNAALIVGERTYLLSGGLYTRYTGGAYARQDEGYPRDVATSLALDLGVPALPEAFRDGVDAGFASATGGIHLFAGGAYLRADAPGTPAPVWGKVRNAFDGGLDAVVAVEGEVFAFRGDQYVRYSEVEDGGVGVADPGFPRTIKDDWGAVPGLFESGVDAAFTLYDRLYLVKGDQYVSDAGLIRTIAQGFADGPDYRLADLFTIVGFAALGPAIAAALVAEDEDPYKTMAALFGWDAAELMWVQRTLPSESDMGFVLAARELFALARRAAVPPSRLPGLEGDDRGTLKRDALLSAVLAKAPELRDSTDLFDQLLIDVDMGGQGTTSRIREAIAAVQLYLHRCMLDLEEAPGLADPARRARLRRWWSWMKNHRVWEANRKVFLNPENYLRPELRDTKTPGFRELESDLLQSGVTSETAQRAYKRYLDEYTEVSRLAIAGGYVDAAEDGAHSLVLFGRTRSAPRRYYYRNATFRDGDKLSATWTPWLKVDVKIGAERVQPVRAFDRVFVFWAAVEDLPPDTSGTTTVVAVRSGDNTQQVSAPVRRAVKIYFSYLNLAQEWVPAQVLTTGPAGQDPVLDVTLAVRPGRLPGTDHQAIVVSYTAITAVGVGGGSFALTPELYTVPVDGVVVPPATGDVTTIFDEPDGIDPESVVWFNRPAGFGDGSWFSVDHKGGSFLCRPIMPTPEPAEWLPIRPPTGSAAERLPSWVRINAGFELPDGTRYFFTNARGGRFTRMGPGATSAEGGRTISGRWGRTEPGSALDAAVLSDDSDTPVVDHTLGAPAITGVVIGPGVPLAVNEAALAALRAGAGEAPERGFGPSDNPLANPSESSRSNWPGHPIAFPAANPMALRLGGAQVALPAAERSPEGWTSVDTAWADGDFLYLTSGTKLIRYTLVHDATDPDVVTIPGVVTIPDVIDAGYPQTLPRALTAVFRGFAISGDLYARVGDWVFRPIAGNWGDLPEVITGAMETKTGVILFNDTQYAVYPKSAAIDRPYEFTELPHDIVRLTTSTAYKLNQRLLAGGVPALLDTSTQETDELPAFDTEISDATTIRVHLNRVKPEWLPGRSHLDFTSANGCYYWEIFCHAPLLIAQALNAAQRFEEARAWYEFIFDPTRPGQPWRFLPFLGADPDALADALRAYGNPALSDAITLLESVAPVFNGTADLTDKDRAALATLPELGSYEELAIAADLPRVYDVTGDRVSLRQAYRDDPFDPHAIAALRPVAYRRAVVTGYIDNLLDWGDMLYRQYTPESVDEARMLYIFAYDLLGRRPEDLGPLPLPATLTFAELDQVTGEDELFGELARVQASVNDAYFYAPVNGTLLGYWDLVADRLTKIRASMDIMGVSRPLPLFAPPIDPMVLVGAVAPNGQAELTASTTAEVPQHRFAYLYRRAQELTDRATQLGSSLLDALDRCDAEALGLLQNQQEAAVLDLTRAVKQAQVTAATENVAALRTGLAGARGRAAYYQHQIETGISALQGAQLTMMAAAAAAHMTSSGLKIAAAIGHDVPEVHIGPFILGVSAGGDEIGDSLDSTAEVAESLGEGLSVLGELLGVRAEQERSMQDNQLQLAIAQSEADQIEHQITAAEAELTIAERELVILDRQIAGQQTVNAFLRDKFTSTDLYQWMSGRLAGLYFQTYGMAVDTARAAERAYQYERGATDTVITSAHWDTRRKGLLAGQSLAFDLDRLGQAYTAQNARRLEITRQISLLELDPVALLTLRRTGSCQFALSEEFFDHDFPGHYRRQIRTLGITFVSTDGTALPVNAMLSQVSHQTVLSADPKAVQYLLTPTGAPPTSVRSDWRTGREIALSQPPEGYENNGLFELRYDDDRYLPFEGTGAVSTWRLTLPGLRSADRPAELYDAKITLRYDADNGGDTFAASVKGLLQPYDTARFIDVTAEFPDEWAEFTGTLTLRVTQDMLPDLHTPQITGIYAAYDLAAPGTARFSLGGTALADGRLVPTPGLSITDPLRLTFSGDRSDLLGLKLALRYRAN